MKILKSVCVKKQGRFIIRVPDSYRLVHVERGLGSWRKKKLINYFLPIKVYVTHEKVAHRRGMGILYGAAKFVIISGGSGSGGSGVGGLGYPMYEMGQGADGCVWKRKDGEAESLLTGK